MNLTVKVREHPALQPPTQAVGQLVNQSRYKRAHKMAQRFNRQIEARSQSASVSAQWWFTAALAAHLAKDANAAISATVFARSAPGFNLVLEGDLKRDEALAYLRIGTPEALVLATSALERAQILHAHDTNRLAALTMVEARIQLARGDAFSAWELLTSAGRRLTDKQWVRNNRFWQFVTSVRLYRRNHPTRRELLRQILHDDPSWRRKVSALLKHITTP